MSETNRTIEEYIELYARDNCNSDQDEAKRHAIVKEVECSLKEK